MAEHRLPAVRHLLVRSAPPTTGRSGAVSTDRLDLAPIGAGHVDALAAVFAKEEVWRYPFGRGLARDETAGFVAAQAEHWETLGFGLWLVTVRAHGRPVGYAGLSVPTFLPEVLPAVEVGWRLDPAAWGMGYATEAATVALACAFGELGLDEVVSLPQVDNPRSVRVTERLGMRRRRTATVPATDRRGALEVAVMAVTAGEWQGRPPDGTEAA
jgi:RimJ/RimL family protein N-acetyltransferase